LCGQYGAPGPGSGRMQIIALEGVIHATEIPDATKRSVTDVLVALIEQSQMEERFGTLLTKSYAAFIKRLQEQHPSLNARDAIVCMFIKNGYDTREIARRNGISPRGIESVRYRLHKKIGRGKHEAIKTYLGSL